MIDFAAANEIIMHLLGGPLHSVAISLMEMREERKAEQEKRETERKEEILNEMLGLTALRKFRGW